MALEEMGELVLHEIGSKLGSKDAAVLGCVNKRLRVSASDESLWINFCSQELNLSVPEDHLGNPTPSFKVAYQKWREAFNMYPWPLVQRVNKCWGSLKSWTATNFPEALTTLRKGVSEAEIKEVEEKLGVKLPLPTKVLYRFCDGQAITGRDSRSALGLIGGYSFYDHLVNVYLLPLSEVITRTKDFVRHLGFSSRNKYIVVAVSSTYREKLFFLNCMNGQLYVGTRNLSSDGEMIPCVSFPLISSVHDTKSCEQQDAMLLWLEEHGRRLNNGIIGLRVEGKHRSISLFPETSPLCSIAITNGIKIRASAVFVPELSDLQEKFDKYWFSYSIRMSLQPDGGAVNGMFFKSCQLYWRHWIIQANDTVVSDVNGEAVIGKYPLLYPGKEEFVYESCTPMPFHPGSVEGSFTFVPGSLRNPKGEHFSVEVSKFPLEMPDYVF